MEYNTNDVETIKDIFFNNHEKFKDGDILHITKESLKDFYQELCDYDFYSNGFEIIGASTVKTRKYWWHILTRPKKSFSIAFEYKSELDKGEKKIMRIYDYNNNATEIELPNNKLIKKIHVVILSGDETGTVIFTDNSKIDFDASKGNRSMAFFDGEYDIEGDIMIQKWMEYEPTDLYLTRSYKRREWFEKEIRKNKIKKS